MACVAFFTHREQLKFDKDKEIKIEIMDSTRSNLSYTLEGEKKDELFALLEDMELRRNITFPQIHMFGGQYLSIRMYGEGVKNSRFPIHLFILTDRPNKSSCRLNNKSYFLDKESIDKLTRFFEL